MTVRDCLKRFGTAISETQLRAPQVAGAQRNLAASAAVLLPRADGLLLDLGCGTGLSPPDPHPVAHGGPRDLDSLVLNSEGCNLL